jgi:hypothetical protein
MIHPRTGAAATAMMIPQVKGRKKGDKMRAHQNTSPASTPRRMKISTEVLRISRRDIWSLSAIGNPPVRSRKRKDGE